MFKDAVQIAAGFTYPVVLSRLTWDNQCSSSIGTFVVVNAEGWAVTAQHIVGQMQQMASDEAVARKYEADRKAADAIADKKARQAALRLLKQPPKESTRRWSVWWGGVATATSTIAGIEAIDIAAVKFDDLDAAKVTKFPVFKDPAKGFEPGRSLCKLGYPFHSFKPTWDEPTNTFHFPPNALPMPRFPMDGIFTRTAEMPQDPAHVQVNFPLRWVETSTPGLRGQSGGPTVDVHGSIWAIQCRTAHYSLGFDPEVPNGNGAKEHQFLNVGLGVHPSTVFGLLDMLGAKYEVSDY